MMNCLPKPAPTNQNAQYLVSSIQLTNGSQINYLKQFNNSTNITAPTTSTFLLAAGHIYSVSYNLRVNITTNGNMSVSPRINTVAFGDYISATVTNATTSQASVGTTFFIDTTGGAVTLDFRYSGSATATSTVGSVSIVQLK